jgi:lysozyme
MKRVEKVVIFCFITLSFLGSCTLPEEEVSLLETGFTNLDSSQIISTTENKLEKVLKRVDTIHYGIDISHFQGDVLQLLKVKEDSLQFVICKATQGTSFLDPMFRTNWRTIKSKGLIRGAYHFYDCSADPIKQADFFSKQIQDLDKTDIAPILDIEQGGMVKSVSAEQMQKAILVFLKRVESNTGRKPLLYTDYWFAQDNFSNPEVANYQLWIADYAKGSQPNIPKFWKKKGFLIWQRGSSYKLDAHQTDLDIMYGSINELVDQ